MSFFKIFSNPDHVLHSFIPERQSTNRLLKNRSVSKLHTPFTTLTELNFSQKTLPWLGSGISSGVGGQLSPCSIRRHMGFGVKSRGLVSQTFCQMQRCFCNPIPYYQVSELVILFWFKQIYMRACLFHQLYYINALHFLQW